MASQLTEKDKELEDTSKEKALLKSKTEAEIVQLRNELEEEKTALGDLDALKNRLQKEKEELEAENKRQKATLENKEQELVKEKALEENKRLSNELKELEKELEKLQQEKSTKKRTI